MGGVENFMFGDSEPLGIDPVVAPNEDLVGYRHQMRMRHEIKRKGIRDVTLLDIAIDHGLHAHSGNGQCWRTTPVAVIRLDYLKAKPIALARLEGNRAIEILSKLADAVAIKNRYIG